MSGINTKVKLNEVTFYQFPAHDLQERTARGLIQASHSAFDSVYGRGSAMAKNEEAQAALGDTKEIPAFIEQLNQHHDPWVTMARDKNERIVSWVYTASKTADEQSERKFSDMLPGNKELWIGWIATHSDAQRQGIARRGVALAIARSGWLQPVSANTWPGESAATVLKVNGLYPATGEAPLKIAVRPGTKESVPIKRYVSGEGIKGIGRTAMVVKSMAKTKKLLVPKDRRLTMVQTAPILES